MQLSRTIAYFSMEVGLEAGMPTYSGGLGILAGDTIRAAADLKVPIVAITLLYRQGYFYQRLAATGEQSEEPIEKRIFQAKEFLKRDIRIAYLENYDMDLAKLMIAGVGVVLKAYL
jgi:starch phosphorylase